MCATAPDARVMRFRRTRADGRFRFRGHVNTVEDALELQTFPDGHANADFLVKIVAKTRPLRKTASRQGVARPPLTR
jgi:hypothetical protein